MKIWTCGHSRGGAATNIMVSKIDRLLNRGGRDGFQELEDGLYELLGTLTYIISRDGTYADVLEDFIMNVQQNAPQIFFHLFYGNTDSVVSQLEELLNQSLQDKGTLASGNAVKAADTISHGELAQLLYDARA